MRLACAFLEGKKVGKTSVGELPQNTSANGSLLDTPPSSEAETAEALTRLTPQAALQAAHEGTRLPGSTTACIVRLDRPRNMLTAANVVSQLSCSPSLREPRSFTEVALCLRISYVIHSHQPWFCLQDVNSVPIKSHAAKWALTPQRKVIDFNRFSYLPRYMTMRPGSDDIRLHLCCNEPPYVCHWLLKRLPNKLLDVFRRETVGS